MGCFKFINSNPQKIEKIILNLINITEIRKIELRAKTHTILIKLYTKLELFEDGIAIYNKITNLGQKDITLINAFINLLVKQNPDDFDDQLQKLKQCLKIKKIELDISSYNTILSYYLKNHYIVKINEILKEIGEANLKKDIVTINQLLDFYNEVGDIESFNKIIELMLQEKINKNIVTNNILLKHYGSLGEIAKITSFFSNNNHKKGQINLRSYNTALLQLANLKKEKEFLENYKKVNLFLI